MITKWQYSDLRHRKMVISLHRDSLLTDEPVFSVPVYLRATDSTAGLNEETREMVAPMIHISRNHNVLGVMGPFGRCAPSC